MFTIDDIINNKKKSRVLNTFKYLIDFSEFGVQVTFVVSSGLLLTLIFCLNLYENFESYEAGFESLFITLISAYITLLGIMFTGIAIFTTLISYKIRDEAKTLGFETKEFVEVFVEISAVISLQVIIFTVLTILMYSNMPLANIWIFYTIVFVVIYLFFYTITVIVTLMQQCIEVHEAVLSIQELKELEEVEKLKKLDRRNNLRFNSHNRRRR